MALSAKFFVSLEQCVEYAGPMSRRFFLPANVSVVLCMPADRAALCEYALGVATSIASNSPVAVVGTKRNLLFARDHSVAESLEYEAVWNMAMLQTDDLPAAATALVKKSRPNFAKL